MSTLDPQGVFAEFRDRAWPIKFSGTLIVGTLAGGTPRDPNVAESWLRSKIADKDDLIRDAVAKVMIEMEMDADTAAKQVDSLKHLNGFKRDSEKGLFIDGRQLKAAMKEAVSVAVASGKLQQKGWGQTRKWISGYFPEHVFVLEDRLYLGVDEPTGVTQKFVHTRFGAGIQYEEYVTNAKIDFTVVTDHDFTPEEWAMLWLTGEQQGLGASRSQGFGRYTVTKWERI